MESLQSSFEGNAFDLDLLQTRIRNLDTDDYAVITGRSSSEDGEIYSALVLPKSEYNEFNERLNEINAARHNQWMMEARQVYDEGGLLRPFVRLEWLDFDAFAGDPRHCTSDSAWEALTMASEAATRLADNAPSYLYHKLTDTIEQLGQKLDDYSLLP